MSPRGSSEDPKVSALRASRCLNPHPEQVSDPLFAAEEFFDARDAVQVKYEMVRRVQVEGASVTATAAAFGYSRPSYYEAAAALAQGRSGRAGRRQTRAPWWSQAHRRGPGLGRGPTRGRPRAAPGRAGRSDRRTVRGPRAPPLDRTCTGPAAGAVQKPLTHPPTTPGIRRPRPCRYDLTLALGLLTCARSSRHDPSRKPARTLLPRPGWTPATSTFAMPSCTNAPTRSPSDWAC